MTVLGFLVPAGLGAVAGFAGRVLLARLRRGVACAPPWPELACAALWAVVGARGADGGLPSWWLPVPLVLAWFAVPLTAADLARRRLPDALTVPAGVALLAAVVCAAAAGGGPGLAARAVAGAVAFGGAHLLVHAVAPGALGAGDVKLSGALGTVLGALGWPALALAAVLAAAVTATVAAGLAAAAALRARRDPARPGAGPPEVGRRAAPGPADRRWSAPHGPGLLAATWVLAAFPASGALPAALLGRGG
jgi:leader peptidase (prepilin peptidase) / N-methyltransferase